MTARPTWRALGDVAQKVVLQRPDHPTILEQIDAVEWAEQQALTMHRLARLTPEKRIGVRGAHRTALTTMQLDTLRVRLQAALETLKSLEFGSEIAR